MEKVLNYQNIVKKILNDYVDSVRSNSDDDIYLIEDNNKKHYLIYHNVWRGSS
jgi:XisI protein